MSNKKGFTIIEIIVTMLIIGILVSISLPIYNTMINQGIANAAGSNLLTIMNAQQVYFFKNGQYCYGIYNGNTPASSACQAQSSACPYCDGYCADNIADINCNLGLNIVDNHNNYYCGDFGDGPECKATTINTNEMLYVEKNLYTGSIICYYHSGYLTSSQYCPNAVPTVTAGTPPS